MDTIPYDRVRLGLMPLGKIDAIRQQVEWLKDAEVTRFSEQRHRNHTIGSQLDYLASMDWPHVFRTIGIENRLIGTTAAYVDHHNGVADLGIMIGDKSVWGNGYGFAAWTQMMALLFSQGIRKIEGGCMATNIPMRKIFSKCGMTKEATVRSHFLVDGVGVDKEIWGKLR